MTFHSSGSRYLTQAEKGRKKRKNCFYVSYVLIMLIRSSYSPREAKYTRCRASSILNPAPFITSVASTTGCSSGTDSQDPGLTDGHSRNMANKITLHKTNNDFDNMLYLKLIRPLYLMTNYLVLCLLVLYLPIYILTLLVLKILEIFKFFLLSQKYFSTSSAKRHSLRSYHPCIFSTKSNLQTHFRPTTTTPTTF